VDFDQVYKKGKRLHGNGFTIIYLMNTFDFSRLGISIHRHIKGAVKRNRIKRIIRESFRLNRDVYPAKADIVFTVKPGFSIDSSPAISDAVSLLFTTKVGKQQTNLR
jgi:ribonuclease P protein component